MADTREKSIDQLNSFLRGELSAVETYRQALEKVKDASILNVLRECQDSHSERVRTLTEQVATFGGKPDSESGAWGTFAKLVEGAATAFGDKTAVAALEEGEDKGLKDYRGDLADLDPNAKQLVQQRMLPAQERTHQAMSQLKKRLAV
ncbi:MAG: PA2169 family four-helix-bundle protein [Polyangiaceae bacterium]